MQAEESLFAIESIDTAVVNIVFFANDATY